ILTGPIVMGNRQDQQMSVIGLTKRPEQVLLCPGVVNNIIKIKLKVQLPLRRQCMHILKSIFFFIFSTVTGSFKATADLPLPMANGKNSCLNPLTETREFL